MFINEVSFSWDYFIKVPNFWALADNLGQKIYEHLGYFLSTDLSTLEKNVRQVGRKKRKIS